MDKDLIRRQMRSRPIRYIPDRAVFVLTAYLLMTIQSAQKELNSFVVIKIAKMYKNPYNEIDYMNHYL